MLTSSFFIAIIEAMQGEFSKLNTKKLIAEEYIGRTNFIVSLEFRNTFSDETIFSFAKIPEKVAPIHCPLVSYFDFHHLNR